MSFCDEWIQKIAEKLPEDCTTDDLIRVGLYNSAHTASMARSQGNGPPYLKVGRKIIYPKPGVLNWLEGKKHESGTQGR
jgi:hypothetical protein